VRQEVFRLCYYVPGFTFDVDRMTPVDRDAYMTLLTRQKDREAKQRRGR
jgi:hypothetical protein